METIEDFDFILGSLDCTYHAPAFFHETLVISLRPARIGRKSWGLEYEIREEKTGRLIARAATTQVQYDYRAGRSVEIPVELRRTLERDRDSVMPAEPPPNPPRTSTP